MVHIVDQLYLQPLLARVLVLYFHLREWERLLRIQQPYPLRHLLRPLIILTLRLHPRPRPILLRPLIILTLRLHPLHPLHPLF